ncbi:plexin domain-containing protein 2-like [Cloeon dipterum]|uniref:plexin domain-containing protein 2-like n=1 Tax=Cloeon dipterum TaxID=197152 RepID=UPI003220706C
MQILYINSAGFVANLFWKNMAGEEHAAMLTDDQFANGTVLIDLPFEFLLFDLNVTRVAVTKEGTIQSEDPTDKWVIAPLEASFGMTRSNISYLFDENSLYVQWNNFRFNHDKFGDQEFSFQVRLGVRGEIDFVYRRVPYNLTHLRDKCDNCLGDKFGVMFPRHELFKVAPYKETYELGFPMDFKKYEVKKGIVMRFFTADWCMGQTNCYDCTETEFELSQIETARCSWCPAIQKCSSTRDSLRNVWMENKCDVYHVNESESCKNTDKDILSFDFYPAVGAHLGIAVIVFVVLVLFKDKIVSVCYTKPSKLLRNCIHSKNQPNLNNGREDGHGITNPMRPTETVV